jgi:hypothetical protein
MLCSAPIEKASVVKCLWGFTKVRYRGLAKNTARLFTAFAVSRDAQPQDPVLIDSLMRLESLLPISAACVLTYADLP